MKPIVVSYHTDAYYQEYAEKFLIPSLNRFSLKYDIRSLPDLGDYFSNLNQRPAFLLRMMEHHQGRDILLIDVDAEIVSFPERVLNCPEEVGVHFLKPSATAAPRPFAGTLFLRNCNGVKELLRLWIDLARAYPFALDQETLGAALAIKVRFIRVDDLPPEYCWVENLMRPLWPKAVPVIRHLMAGGKRPGTVGPRSGA